MPLRIDPIRHGRRPEACASPVKWTMEKQYGFTYEVRFNTSDYTYVTGNAAFYDFRGAETYANFNVLLANDSLEVIKREIDSKEFGKPFVLDIFTQENIPCPMVCVLEDIHIPEQVVLHMIELEKMTSRFAALETEQREHEALLAQFDCIYFSYDRATNEIISYRYDGGKKILETSTPEKWRELNLREFTEDSHEVLNKFAENLKNGTRNFAGNLAKKEKNKFFRFMGTAIYDNDVHIKTVGTIGDTATKPIQEMVRRDQLTGLFLKEYITNYGQTLINDMKKGAALAIVDIDNFKSINDNFGHSTGDVVLKKCAAIIMDQVGDTGKVGRIGGDEFFVVFDNYDGREKLKYILRGIKNNVLHEYNDDTDGFHISTSIGLSEYPNDADDFDTLFDLADHMLYRAKYKGKNRYIMYEREKHGTVKEVLQSGVKEIGLSGRRGLSKSETVCRIADLDRCGKTYALENILSDVIKYFAIERINLYNKTDRRIECVCGAEPLKPDIIEETIDYLYDEDLSYFYVDNVMVINNVNMFKTKSIEIYNKVVKQDVCSIMHHKITGKSGKVFVISYEITSGFITWNLEDMYLYRLLDSIIEKRL